MADPGSRGVADVTIPVTYMNSTAAIKAFTGEHGGTICTSSNADKSLAWAFEQGEKVLFRPTSILGATPRSCSGAELGRLRRVRPHKPGGGSAGSNCARRR